MLLFVSWTGSNFIQDAISLERNRHMERLEQDVSYLIGNYLAVARKIEIELNRMEKNERPSLVEKHFEDFVDEPAKYLSICQEEVIQSLLLLKKLGKPELIEDMGEVFRLINIKSLEHVTLRPDVFIHGYHKKLAEYGENG